MCAKSTMVPPWYYLHMLINVLARVINARGVADLF